MSGPVTGPRGDRPDRALLASVVGREAAAVEERHWVRLTRRCNNRCVFCHDAERHDGTAAELDEVRRDIVEGRRRGAARLVLSGGEATLHPGFVEAVAAGREAGYRWVQVITNGRMFAYERFTARAVAAGLDEATLSLHGHRPEIHDAIAGARGALAQALQGLRNLRRAGRVVSVDTVVCRPNVRHLPEMLRTFLALGVREFDLLWLVPFGRASGAAAELEVDPEEARPFLLEALAVARLPGVHVWTNRWPAPLLEGAEELLQDPHKLLDDVRGTAEGFQAYLDSGRGPDCRGERCPRCFLEGFCAAMAAARERLAAGTFDVVAVDGAACAGPGARADVARQRRAALRVRAPDGAAAAAALERLGSAGTPPVELDLHALENVPAQLAARARRAVVRREADLDRAMALPSAELEIPLDRSTLPLARRALSVAADRVVLRWPARALLSDTLARGVRPEEIAEVARTARCEGIPPCLAPRAVPLPAALDARWLRPGGGLDLLALAEGHVSDGSRARSLRCGRCEAAARCAGAHVNEIRAHGFGWMCPLAAAG